MSSGLPPAVSTRRSFSTWTIRWAPPPAWRAANVCRRVPPGALMPAREVALSVPDKSVNSLCPYCGVGCQLTYHVKNDQILYVEGRDGPANHVAPVRQGPLWIRLFAPSATPHGAADPPLGCAEKPANSSWIPNNVMQVFREATWEEALDLGGGTLRRLRDTLRTKVAGRDSARPRAATKRRTCSRSWCALGFGSNNVDHCTRLCHASSVAALLEGIGSGAVSNPVMDVTQASVVIADRRQPDGESSGRRDVSSRMPCATAPS